MSGLLHLVQRRRDWAGPQPAQAPPRCTYQRPVCQRIRGFTTMRYTNRLFTYLLTVLLYNGQLLCGFNVPVKAVA